jgi:hypothetical protein
LIILLSAAAAGQAPADLIIRDAHIVTVDPQFSTAQAAAIRDGRFIAVGSDADVMKSAGPKTRIVDLHGKTVLPGFNDTHVHLTAGEDLPTQVDLTHIRSIKDIQAAIAARAAKSKPGEWIVGTRGWWEYQLAEGRLPTRGDLDEAAPNNPVAIPGPHYVIVNSRALALAHVTRDTPDPQGGQIYHDASGEPSGLLMDNAGRFVRPFMPQPTEAQKEEGMRRVLALVNSHGLTSAGDPSGSPADAALFRKLRDQGQLTVRVDFAYNIDPAEPLDKAEAELRALRKPGSDGDGMFRSDEIGETGLDGAELTALLEHDYPDKPGYRGNQEMAPGSAGAPSVDGHGILSGMTGNKKARPSAGFRVRKRGT